MTNLKQVEVEDRQRRFAPTVRRKIIPLREILSGWLWYQGQRLRKDRDPLFPPDGVLPPMPLRKKVNGLRDIRSYLEAGAACLSDVRGALAAEGHNLGHFRRILDFGCGCGRVLSRVRESAPAAAIVGVDNDEEAIRWCSENLVWGSFHANSSLPPLPFEDSSFDLTLAISLFTHFDEDSQLAWIGELARVIQPHGILVASAHGEYCWSDLPKDIVEEVRAKGFAFRRTHPEWPDNFQTAYHSPTYVERVFGRDFCILQYIHQGSNQHQDLVVLQRLPHC